VPDDQSTSSQGGVDKTGKENQMFNKFAFAAVFSALVSPAFAEPGETLRRALDLEPGKYSLSELGVIFQSPSKERAQRIKAIDRKKAAVQDMMREEVERYMQERATVSTQQ
jgi:hypothetical protein